MDRIDKIMLLILALSVIFAHTQVKLANLRTQNQTHPSHRS